MADLPPEPSAELLDERREPLPRRVVAIVTTLVLVVLAAGFLVDHRVRGREEAALSTCEADAEEAIEIAYGPMRSAVDYVRGGLVSVPPGQARDDIYALVADAAVGSADELTPASRECADLDVLWVHPDLRDRRDACVARLAEHAAYLERVADDGRAAFGEQPVLAGPC